VIVPRTRFTKNVPRPMRLVGPTGTAMVRKAQDGEPLIQRVNPTVNPDLLQYEAAYERNAWVFRAIVAKAANIGEVPLKVVRVEADGTEKPDTSDAGKAVLNLIQRPNSSMAGNDLIEAIVICKNVRQALVWLSWGTPEQGPRDYLQKMPRPPQNIFLLPAHKTFAKYSGNRLLGWQVRDTATFIPAAQVIQICNYNPREPYRGMPPISPAFQSADSDYALEIHHANFFENGMKLSGLLSIESDVSEEKRRRIEAAIEAMTGVGNAHTILALDAKATFQSFTAEQKDMDFKNLAEKHRDKIGSSFGVPRFIFGDPIDANRNTAEVSRRMFWIDTLLPEMGDIEDQLNEKLVKPYYGVDLRLRFDRSQIEALSENRTEFAAAFNQLATGLALLMDNSKLASPVITSSEARSILIEHFGLNIPNEQPSIENNGA